MNLVPTRHGPLRYLELGAGAPLLLLHGNTYSATTQERLAARFADEHRVISVDLLGHGQSARPEGLFSTRYFAMQGEAVADLLGATPALTLWSSPAGRALQTLAVITDHLALDWHDARTDPRLVEIGVGSWGGRTYREIVEERGAPVVLDGGLLVCAPDGETYPEIAARVSGWLADTADETSDRLIIMHGISSAVLRGLMTGRKPAPSTGAPLAPALPQGSVVLIEGGAESVAHRGRGGAPA